MGRGLHLMLQLLAVSPLLAWWPVLVAMWVAARS
jgi:hypothetical protein